MYTCMYLGVWKYLVAKCEDSEQTHHPVADDLCLHCFAYVLKVGRTPCVKDIKLNHICKIPERGFTTYTKENKKRNSRF